MKRVTRLLSVAVFLFCTITAFAQQATTPGATPGQATATQRTAQTPESVANTQIEWMKADLKLNDATLAKVSEVVLRITKVRLEERNKVQAAGGDQAAMYAKSDEYYAKMDAELKPILGDATYAIYAKEVAEKRAANRAPRPTQATTPGSTQGAAAPTNR